MLTVPAPDQLLRGRLEASRARSRAQRQYFSTVLQIYETLHGDQKSAGKVQKCSKTVSRSAEGQGLDCPHPQRVSADEASGLHSW